MKLWLTTGVTYSCSSILENERLEDLHLNIERGNHKSANLDPTLLTKTMRDEVLRGWQLILPTAVIVQIPGAIVSPMGIVHQETINEQGNPEDKTRTTHDLSFNPVKDTVRSVNARVDPSKLSSCKFGRALHRYIVRIVELRIVHPQESILQTKVDWKAAYRRMHHSAATALVAMVTIGHLTYIFLSLTFEGSPNPSC